MPLLYRDVLQDILSQCESKFAYAFVLNKVTLGREVEPATRWQKVIKENQRESGRQRHTGSSREGL